MPPNVLQKLQRGLEVGLRAAQQTPDMGLVAEHLDQMIESGNLPSADAVDEWLEEKAIPRKRKTRLDVHKTSTDMAYASYYRFIREFSKKKDEAPEYGAIDRDYYLSKLWQKEPILAGAVYSMCAKMVSLKWQITGRRNLAIFYADVFANTAYMGGRGWGGFNSASANDFYTTDRGVFWAVNRRGNPIYSRMEGLEHIDSLQCTLTGNSRRPVDYLSELTSQQIRFRPGEYIHFSSLPSPREVHLGIGFCATSRALRAAKLLMGLHDYDSEKLSNLPPEGVAAITGLTMDEFQDALVLWQAARKKAGSLTFPQVLWLIGSQPNAQVTIDFVGFSQVPESFDRKIVVNQYVNTLALDFGVDAREFWPVSSGALGTAAETEVQHMKARGKGPGEYITITERELNAELPNGVEFKYDTQDIEEDQQSAAVAKAWIEAFLPLTTAGGATEEIISKDLLMRLLADKGVIPDWMVQDDRVVADDLGVEEKYWSDDPVITIEWDGGVLKQLPGKPYTLSYQITGVKPKVSGYIPAETLKGGSSWESADAAVEFLKQAEATLEPKRNIRGNPIPDKDALTGAVVTQTAIETEMELWRKHPELSKYLPESASED